MNGAANVDVLQTFVVLGVLCCCCATLDQTNVDLDTRRKVQFVSGVMGGAFADMFGGAGGEGNAAEDDNGAEAAPASAGPRRGRRREPSSRRSIASIGFLRADPAFGRDPLETAEPVLGERGKAITTEPQHPGLQGGAPHIFLIENVLFSGKMFQHGVSKGHALSDAQKHTEPVDSRNAGKLVVYTV